MSSRDPGSLRAELDAIEVTDDTELLAELRAEASETAAAQVDALQDIDTKASRILRVNVVLIGVLVSALSIAARFGSERAGLGLAGSILNSYTKLGVASLVLSTAFAAMTYTASELDVGPSAENLTGLLRADLPRQEVEALLVKNYVVRINFNRSTNVRNIPLIQLTILLAVVAVVLLTLGVHQKLVGSVPSWLLVAAVGLVVGTVRIAGLPTQLRRAIADYREWP